MFRIGRRGRRLLILLISSAILAVFGLHVVGAQDATTLEGVAGDVGSLKISIDTTWVLLTGFLVFFMQCGFAMLETGMISQKGAVNALLENFIDAGLTAVVWWLVGFGIAF
ncbi:MAG: ammonium transporter, partial [Anaerolineae bacterium]|nr:ammonium transporter [Anaerolineae bacterium]